jgi:hypothetical protein
MSKIKSKGKTRESKPVGRPSKYKPEYCDQVEKLCKLGATDKDIADFFEVEESTINNWKVEHPEFMESIKTVKRLKFNECYLVFVGYNYSSSGFDIGRFDLSGMIELQANGDCVSPSEVKVFKLPNLKLPL